MSKRKIQRENSLKCQKFGHYFIFSATLHQLLGDSDKIPSLMLVTFVGNIKEEETEIKEFKSPWLVSQYQECSFKRISA